MICAVPRRLIQRSMTKEVFPVNPTRYFGHRHRSGWSMLDIISYSYSYSYSKGNVDPLHSAQTVNSASSNGCRRRKCQKRQQHLKPYLYRRFSSAKGATTNNNNNHNDGTHHQQRRPRSPYAVLNLKTSATERDIKHAFRKQAKKYHPDLNLHLSPSESLKSQSKMAEIIEAYQQLMDDDFLGARVGDGRVALACEMFTLEELQMDRLHDVYSLRISLEGQGDNDRDENEHGDGCKDEGLGHGQGDAQESQSSTLKELSNDYIIDTMAHPDDSISDLKRQIQSKFEAEWGLGDRRMDRDQIRTGWELVCRDKRIPVSSTSTSTSTSTSDPDADPSLSLSVPLPNGPEMH